MLISIELEASLIKIVAHYIKQHRLEKFAKIIKVDFANSEVSIIDIYGSHIPSIDYLPREHFTYKETN